MLDFRFQPQMTDAELEKCDLVSDAAHNLMQAFCDSAPAEALTRALVHERSQRREDAMFWTEVYSRCAKQFG